MDAGFSANACSHRPQSVLIVFDDEGPQRQLGRRVESSVLNQGPRHFLSGSLPSCLLVLGRLKRVLIIAGIYGRAILEAGGLQKFFGKFLRPIYVLLKR